ncbi:MAG: hypothetical protein WC829_02795 [Hyphomicrobium sp.]|jgi:hypothetical protein
MTFTDCGTFVRPESVPLAMANGMEWAKQRKGQSDRLDCLYNRGLLNKALWYSGVVLAVLFPVMIDGILIPDWKKMSPGPKVLLPRIPVPLKKARVGECQTTTGPMA